MKISEKIEQVRRQPEHIRIRYVWGSVAVCMFFVVAIWIFSIGSLFQGEKNATSPNSSSEPDLSQQLQDLKTQAPSIKDFTDNASAVMNEGVSGAQNSNTDQQQQPTTQTEIPQASAYSDLSNQMISQ